MIGNDVIDLSYASKMHQWQNPRFIKKVFTSAEIAKIEANLNSRVLIQRAKIVRIRASWMNLIKSLK